MNNIDVVHILSSLSSSKIKERNTALDDLTTILKDKPSRIPTKTLHSTSETLIEVLDLEHRRYCDLIANLTESKKSKLSLIESRLSTIAYVLRLFIEKTCFRFKQRTVNLYLAVLPELMVKEHSKTLLELVSVHLSFALIGIIESDPFQLKFTAHQWSSLMEKICLYFDHQLRISISDRTISNFIIIISSLLTLDTVGLFQSSLTIHNTVQEFIIQSEKETSDTRLVLNIINQLVAKTHTNNIAQTLSLIYETWRYAFRLNDSSNESIQDELFYFYILSTDLIQHRLPEMTGLRLPNFQDETFISLYNETLRIRLNDYKPKLLDCEIIKYNEISLQDTDWFRFTDLQLKETSNPRPWFSLLSLLKLLGTFFELKNLSVDLIPLFKKSKTESEFSSLLGSCSSTESFLIASISKSTNLTQQLTSLQLFTFFASNFDIREEYIHEFKELILKKYENIELTTWTTIALIPLLTQSKLELTENDITRIFKLCLPLIKNSEICKPACIVISMVIGHSKKLILDSNVKNQVYDIYELSDINGPILVCNEAFMFWEYLHYCSTEYRSREGNSREFRVITWLKDKWNQSFVSSNYQDNFYLFIVWLTSNNIKNCNEDKKLTMNGKFDYYELWKKRSILYQEYSDQRKFLIQLTTKNKEIKIIKSPYTVGHDSTNTKIINDLLYRCLDNIERPDIHSTEIQIRWIFEILRIVDHIKYNPEYEEFIRAFKTTIYLSASSLKFISKNMYTMYFHELLRDNFDVSIILPLFDTRSILSDFKKQYLQGDLFNDTDDEFENHSPSNSHRRSTTPIIGENQSLTFNYDLELSFSTIFHIYKDTNSNMCFNLMLDFLDGLSTKSIILCLKWLKKSCFKTAIPIQSIKKNEKFEELTVLIGEKLLSSKFNTYSGTVECLADYLLVVLELWLSDPTSTVFTYCNDILDWLIARFEDNSFSGVDAMKCLAFLFLRILMYPNLSQNTSKGTKQRIFDVLVQCLRRLDNASIVCLEGTIIEYMKHISYKNQNIFISELQKIFQLPQQSIEWAALYTLTFSKMTSVSYSILICSLCDMLSYHEYTHLYTYTVAALRTISKIWNLESPLQLFDVCKLDLISSWFKCLSEGKENMAHQWDVTIFGFLDIDEFYSCYSKEIGAVYMASGSNDKAILNHLLKSGRKNEADIFTNSFHMVIPIAFVENNIGSLIFEVGTQLLGRNLRLYEEKFSLLTFKCFLRLLDLGTLQDVQVVAARLFSKIPEVGTIFKWNPISVRYQFPLNINLITGLKFLHSQFLIENFVTMRNFEKLILWELTELEGSITLVEKLRCLREMRYIVLHFWDVLLNCDMLHIIITKLSKYVLFEYLIEEVFILISVFVDIAKRGEMNISRSFAPLFFQIMMAKEIYNRKLSDEVLNLLSLISKSSIGNGLRLWSLCVDFLNDAEIHVDWPSLIILLNSDYCSWDSLSLISLLLTKSKELNVGEIDYSTSENIVKKLLNFEIDERFQSRNFQVLEAYLIKNYYRTCGKKIDLNDTEPISKICQSIFEVNEPLNVFYTQFLTYRRSDENARSIKSSFRTEIIFDLVVDLNQKSSSFEEEDFTFRNKLDVIQETIYSSIFNNWEPTFHIDDVVNDTQFYRETPYDIWSTSLASALLNILSYSVPIITIFNPLLKESSEFYDSIFNVLVGLSIHYDPKGLSEWVPKLASTTLSNKNCLDYEKKIDLFLRIIYITRFGAKEGNKYCSKVYSKVDLNKVCSLTIGTKYSKFGLLLYEELYMGHTRKLDIHLLSEIYYDLADKDLQSGLPPAHSLSEAFNSITKLEQNSWKNFAFSNAKFDSTYHGQNPDDLNILKNITELNGFYGLANSISTKSISSKENEAYKWNFLLDKWDLPLPEEVSTISKGLYYSLKKVGSETISVTDSLVTSLPLMVNSKKNFSVLDDWLVLLSEIASLIEIIKNLKKPKNTIEIFEDLNHITKNIATTLSYNDYKPIMQGRHLVLSVLSSNRKLCEHYDPIILSLTNILALKEATNTSIQQHSSQDTLRNSFVMQDLVNKGKSLMKDTGIETIVDRSASFISAIALWDSGDYKTSIMIMNDLLKTHINLKDYKSSPYYPFIKYLNIAEDEVKGYLIKWYSESRMEPPNRVYKKYIQNAIVSTENHQLRAETYHIFGDFLHSQVKKLQNSDEIGKSEERCHADTSTLEALKLIYNNSNVLEHERKDAKRHYYKVQLQLNRDKTILDELKTQEQEFVWNALHFFLNTLIFTDKYDSDVMDKFCGMWFENADNDNLNIKLLREIGTIPSWKFLPWVNQISSKLNNDSSEFQKPLQLTMKRLLYKLPYESLYSVLSIKLYKNYSLNSDESMLSKIAAVEKILRDLQSYDKGSFHTIYISPIENFCEMSVEMASFKVREADGTIKLKNLKMGQYWLNELQLKQIPLPTDHITIRSSEDGRKPRPYIVSVSDTIKVTSTGISLPKIINFKMSDGYIRQALMKGSNDDLRQDAIMEQVFTQVNSILEQHEDFRKLNLRIRTYKVIPLGPKAGIIEFVSNSSSLHQILRKYHSKDQIKFDQARKGMKDVQAKSNSERLKAYMKITGSIEPQLRNFFFEYFQDYNEWFEAKSSYSKGVATNSIVGYILGLGDRHLNNILLDFKSGEPIHIDLGIAFDQGRLLPIPELVPFRLTRDIVDGFGVTGVDGLFKRNCERVYAALRRDSEKVMCVLNILKWDPLYSWVMSPVTKHKHILDDDTELYSNMAVQQKIGDKANMKNNNQESFRALKGVEEKLNGDGLSIEAKIEELIQEAISPENLSVIYMGWSPFY